MREHVRCDITRHPLPPEHCIERYALAISIDHHMARFSRRTGSDSEIVHAKSAEVFVPVTGGPMLVVVLRVLGQDSQKVLFAVAQQVVDSPWAGTMR